MAVSIVMPALEMAQETGKIISWMKKEGDTIAKGEPIAEIETDKVVLEIEAPADGMLAGVKAAAGDVVPVGQTIAWIVAPGEQPPVEEKAPSQSARTMTEQAPVAAPARRPRECRSQGFTQSQTDGERTRSRSEQGGRHWAGRDH